MPWASPSLWFSPTRGEEILCADSPAMFDHLRVRGDKHWLISLVSEAADRGEEMT